MINISDYKEEECKNNLKEDDDDRTPIESLVSDI